MKYPDARRERQLRLGRPSIRARVGLRIAAVFLATVGLPVERADAQDARRENELRSIVRYLETSEVVDTIPLASVFIGLRDGGVAYLELEGPSVAVFDRKGGLVWRVARRGRGPGELMLPYRITETPSRSIIVSDLGTGTFTEFGRDGRVLRSRRLQPPVTQVDELVATADGRLIVVAELAAGPLAGKSVHVFDSTWRHERSFSASIPTRDRAKALRTPHALIARATDSTVLVTTRVPYTIREVTPSGRVLRTWRPSVKMTSGPDQWWAVDRNRSVADGFRERLDSLDIAMESQPLPGGRVLSHRAMRGQHWLDVLSLEPRSTIESQRMPRDLRYFVVGPDGTVWLKREIETGEAELRRIQSPAR